MKGSEFKAWRERRGYTQTSIAQELGVSRFTVINWEKMEDDLPRILVLAIKGLEVTFPSVAGAKYTAAEYREMRARNHQPGAKASRKNRTGTN